MTAVGDTVEGRTSVGHGVRSRFAGVRQPVLGVVVAAGVIGLAVVMARAEPVLAPLWLLGVAAGFALQRSRFCFASAFRDLFLFGQSRIMRGILAGLVVATIGFALVMMGEVPFPRFGALPAEAHVLPSGLSTVIAGLVFGVGMVLAGGCVSGSLYRAAEGYVGSWVAIAGIVAGLGLLAHTWNWWWEVLISREPTVWLAGLFGYGGAVVLTLVALGATFLVVLWWEQRSGMPAGTAGTDSADGDEPTELTVVGQLGQIWQGLFARGWSPVVGGAVLGIIAVLMYVVHHPWGVTGELSRWGNGLMAVAAMPPPELAGLSDIGGCTGRAAAETGAVFTHTFTATGGALAGALLGALFAREFKLRVPRRRRRYGQSFGGGLLMGYGAGLGIGCTIGAFFSAIPSLALSGWLFGLALLGGAFLGTKAIQRL